MPDVTLTPVAGDPWNGGAQDLDPVTAPPLTVSLGATPQPDPAPYGATDPPSPDGVALQQQSAALGQSLVSGHSGDDLVSWLGGNLPRTSSPALAYGTAAAAMPLVAGARAVDGLVNSAQWAHDVQTGRYGTFLDNPDADAQVVPGAVQAAMTMGVPGLGMAEEGALGAAGGKAMAKAAADDPFAAMMAKLDAQAPIAAPRGMAETGIVDPSAASWRLHHGTGDAWDVFDPAKAGARTSGAERGALFMSPREGEAASYAHGDGARVLSLDVTPGNTGVYDAAQLLASRDPRFMAASRAEFTGSQAAYDAALKRSDADVAYHQDLRGSMPADIAAEMPAYPAVSNLLSPQSAAISMARADGRDTAILRGLGESSGGDQVVALRPGFVRDANTGAVVYAGGGSPEGAMAAGALQSAERAPLSRLASMQADATPLSRGTNFAKVGKNIVERNSNGYGDVDFTTYKPGPYRRGDKSDPLASMALKQHADGRYEVDNVQVDPQYRRQGLATSLYEHVQNNLGTTMQPSGQLLPDGYAFWQNRDPAAVQYHRQIDGPNGTFYSPKQLQAMTQERTFLGPAPYQAAFDALPPEAKTPEAMAKMFAGGIPGSQAAMAAQQAPAQPETQAALLARLLRQGGRT